MKESRRVCDRCGWKQSFDRPNAPAWLFFKPESGVHIWQSHFPTLDLCPKCAREFEAWFINGSPIDLFPQSGEFDPEESPRKRLDEKDAERDDLDEDGGRR